jgi:hypothetical protein
MDVRKCQSRKVKRFTTGEVAMWAKWNELNSANIDAY